MPLRFCIKFRWVRTPPGPADHDRVQCPSVAKIEKNIGNIFKKEGKCLTIQRLWVWEPNIWNYIVIQITFWQEELISNLRMLQIIFEMLTIILGTAPRRSENFCDWFLVIVQLDAQIHFNIFIYSSLHVSSKSCSSSGETDCINTASGKCHSVLVAVSCAGCSKHVENYK